MGDTIAIVILIITLSVMCFLFGRYFVVRWKSKHSNTEEDMKHFYANDFKVIPSGLAREVIKQFYPNEQVAAVYACKYFGEGAYANDKKLSQGEKAMAKIAHDIRILSTHEGKGIQWDPGVINALLRVRFDEIQWAIENKEPIPNRAVGSSVYKFGADEKEAAAIRKDICTVVDDLCKSPLPFGPAFVRHKEMFCRVYPHYDRDLLKSFDSIRSKLTFGWMKDK